MNSRLENPGIMSKAVEAFFVCPQVIKNLVAPGDREHHMLMIPIPLSCS